MKCQASAVRVLLAAMAVAHANPAPKKLERMLFAKMRLYDQDGSSTGYAYEQRGPEPVSFVQYSQGAVAEQQLPSYQGYPVYAYGDYDYDYPPAVAPYYPGPYLEPPHLTPPHETGLHRYGVPHGHHGDDVSYEQDSGAEHEAEEHSAHGERGDKGYAARNEFDLADKEHREADYQEGEYKDEAGHKVGHEESNSQYDAHDKSEAGQQGENYGNKSYKKKGSRTSGFHNVYRKDEYKKDTEFYDEDHDGGHYEKYGSHDAAHKDEVAGYEKAGKHDSGFERDEHGKAGHFDKGREHSLHQGHEGAEGEDSYREEHADYASKAGGHRSGQRGHSPYR